MACISVFASLQSVRYPSSRYHVFKKQQPQVRATCTLQTNEEETPYVKRLQNEQLVEQGFETGQFSSPKFGDKRWKKGTWDLNMFVKDGKMDWDGVIVAEARRRKFLALYPEAATNQEPVSFRSSIIPWWAWLMRFYFPQAELLNGRAAMLGFFTAYFVDVLTGLDVVGQSGNFICKAGLFLTVLGVIIFKQSEDVENLRKLAEEATLYDKQWQASWKDQNTIDNK